MISIVVLFILVFAITSNAQIYVNRSEEDVSPSTFVCRLHICIQIVKYIGIYTERERDR